MSLIASIASLGIKDLVISVLDRIKLPPERKAEIERALQQNAHELAKLELELKRVEVESASSTIRAEAASGDKYTSRARPTFLYIANFIILWNYVIAPLIGRPVLDFPEPLFWLFGSVMLGYVGARSWEKYAAIRSNQT